MALISKWQSSNPTVECLGIKNHTICSVWSYSRAMGNPVVDQGILNSERVRIDLTLSCINLMPNVLHLGSQGVSCVRLAGSGKAWAHDGILGKHPVSSCQFSA